VPAVHVDVTLEVVLRVPAHTCGALDAGDLGEALQGPLVRLLVVEPWVPVWHGPTSL
jgi:hypothetical protein